MKSVVFLLTALIALPLFARSMPTERRMRQLSDYMSDRFQFGAIITDDAVSVDYPGNRYEYKLEGRRNGVQGRKGSFLYMEMAQEKPKPHTYGMLNFDRGSILFNLSQEYGYQVYNIELCAPDGGELGNLQSIMLSNGDRQTLKFSAFEFRNHAGSKPAVKMISAGPVYAENIAGEPSEFYVHFFNQGGGSTDDLRFFDFKFPSHVKFEGNERRVKLPGLGGRRYYTHVMKMSAPRPVSGSYRLTLNGNGAPQTVLEGKLDFIKPPQPAEAVTPVKTGLPVGAFYRTDVYGSKYWSRIREITPGRRPAYGWYDNYNAEYLAAQSRHLVENGISFLLADWYWHGGKRLHQQWEQAFAASPGAAWLKWAPVWRDLDDSLAGDAFTDAVDYLVTAHFDQEYCLKINGEPVVVLPFLPREAGELLHYFREAAREAGHDGVCFLLLLPGSVLDNAAEMKRIAELGIDFTVCRDAIYFNERKGSVKPEDPYRMRYETVANSFAELWKRTRRQNKIPLLPTVSTGFNDTPLLHDSAIIVRERTPEAFRKACAEARQYANQAKVPVVLLGPLNDWETGSYLEPNGETGFRMFETVREVFGIKPAGGFPLNTLRIPGQ